VYWKERLAKSQDAISRKSEAQIKRQLNKYYASTTKKVIEEFVATYEKLLNTMENGKQPTPADLYKLDKYWQAQAQMRTELEKLGNREIAALSRAFERDWFEIYYSIGIEGATAFNTVDKEAVKQMLNQIWCADGKSWSARIWDNTSRLAETLNEGLIHTVAAGKPTGELKKLLQERFNVSYSRADALVRTELAHIQTQAAEQRYKDYGIQEVQIWADEDERRCEVCGKLHEKRYPIGAVVPIPAHTNCRCCIVPVVDK
jgi:SPP1 gp7 family putative phage head morphogenesis protein